MYVKLIPNHYFQKHFSNFHTIRKSKSRFAHTEPLPSTSGLLSTVLRIYSVRASLETGDMLIKTFTSWVDLKITSDRQAARAERTAADLYT